MALPQRRLVMLENVGVGFGTTSVGVGVKNKSLKSSVQAKKLSSALTKSTTNGKAMTISKAASRIPVSKSPSRKHSTVSACSESSTCSSGQSLNGGIPSPLTDLSWKFSPDSRASSPILNSKVKSTVRPVVPAKPPVRPKSKTPLPSHGRKSTSCAATGTIRRKEAASRKKGLKDDPTTPCQKTSQNRPLVETSEERAIKELQELVRRQQEELEEYNQELHQETVLAEREYPNEENNNSFLLSSCLVQQISSSLTDLCKGSGLTEELKIEISSDEPVTLPTSIDEFSVEVNGESTDNYCPDLKVKSLEQETPKIEEIHEDPRLTATKSRLNQRLQHLLEGQMKRETLQGMRLQQAEADRLPDEQGSERERGTQVTANTCDNKENESDPRRKSIYIKEDQSLVLDAQEAWMTHQDPIDSECDEPHYQQINQENWESNNNQKRPDDDEEERQHQQQLLAREYQQHLHAMQSDQKRELSSKDQYHQEIRQLLKKLHSSDDFLYPNEPDVGHYQEVNQSSTGEDCYLKYAKQQQTNQLYNVISCNTETPEPIYAVSTKQKKTSQGEYTGVGSVVNDTQAQELYYNHQQLQPQREMIDNFDMSSMKQNIQQQQLSSVYIQDASDDGDQYLIPPIGDFSSSSGRLGGGDARVTVSGARPSRAMQGSDLSLTSNDTTARDDGIGDEVCRTSTMSRRAASAGDLLLEQRNIPPRKHLVDVRDLSMDSGIQGSSCDLDAAADSSSSASEHHEDDDMFTKTTPRSQNQVQSTSDLTPHPQETRSPPARPAPIGGCEAPESLPVGEAFKAVDELYVSGATLTSKEDNTTSLAASTGNRVFTETHFDTTINLDSTANSGSIFKSTPVSLDKLSVHAQNDVLREFYSSNRLKHATECLMSSVSVEDLLTSSEQVGISTIPPTQAFAREIGSDTFSTASMGNLYGKQATTNTHDTFARSRSRRFNSVDDVSRASLLRHSLPAKPPRASMDDGLSKRPGDALPISSLTVRRGKILSSRSSSIGSEASPPIIEDEDIPSPGKLPTAEPPFYVVVAVDFGTTYSGYAFCYIRDPECNIHMMRKWEGGDPGLHNEKTPTTLLLTPEGKFHSFGFLARDTFHDLHPDHAKRWLYFDKFKMSLLNQATLTRDTALTAANGHPVPALTVLSLSLRHLRERALAELAAADVSVIGCSGSRSESGIVRWVLTVPALWGPSATQLLREAAHNAGMESVLIALEPEAASLCCRQLRLHQLLHGDHRPEHPTLVMNPGDGTQYMVVDCGGGTVDITVHELTGERATLRELHKASGGACGSLGVDREFERLLSSVFGADFMTQFRHKRPAAYVELLLSFEARKRSAAPDREAPLAIFPPFGFIDSYRKYRGKEIEHAIRKFGRPHEISWSSQGMIRLSPKLMADLFRPTLDHICAQIEEVLRSSRVGSGIQYMFLVGGFSESLMLQHRVRAQFGQRVKVVVPQGVGLATLRGAVLYGLDPGLVSSRRSKHTLGVGVLKRFQEGEHPPDKLVRLSDGSSWCSDLLDVLVLADQPLGPGETVTRSYTPASSRQTNIIIHIYCTSDSSPPKFVTDPGVNRCGTLRLSLPAPEDIQDSRKSREILARLEFGGTELGASALDISSGRCVRTQLDFLSTAV